MSVKYIPWTRRFKQGPTYREKRHTQAMHTLDALHPTSSITLAMSGLNYLDNYVIPMPFFKKTFALCSTVISLYFSCFLSSVRLLLCY